MLDSGVHEALQSKIKVLLLLELLGLVELVIIVLLEVPLRLPVHLENTAPLLN